MISPAKRQKIRRVALGVRKWADAHHSQMGFPESLCGMCGIAAAKLAKELRREKIYARIVSNNYHAFVMYGEMIIDITATQFGKYPQVMVRNQNKLKKNHWDKLYSHRSASAFQTYQRDTRWPLEQVLEEAEKFLTR